MNPTFQIGQKVERKGKFYIVAEIIEGRNAGDRDIAVRSINKKTGQPWQAPMYFSRSEFKPA